jgi:hypothetical protein
MDESFKSKPTSWVETNLIAVILTLMDSSSEVDLKIALAEVVTTTE